MVTPSSRRPGSRLCCRRRRLTTPRSSGRIRSPGSSAPVSVGYKSPPAQFEALGTSAGRRSHSPSGGKAARIDDQEVVRAGRRSTSWSWVSQVIAWHGWLRFTAIDGRTCKISVRHSVAMMKHGGDRCASCHPGREPAVQSWVSPLMAVAEPARLRSRVVAAVLRADSRKSLGSGDLVATCSRMVRKSAPPVVSARQRSGPMTRSRESSVGSISDKSGAVPGALKPGHGFGCRTCRCRTSTRPPFPRRSSEKMKGAAVSVAAAPGVPVFVGYWG